MSYKVTSGNVFLSGREVPGGWTFLTDHTGRIVSILNTVPGYRIDFLSM